MSRLPSLVVRPYAWLGLAAALAACSIPDTAFHASPDSGGGSDGADSGMFVVTPPTPLAIAEGETGSFTVALQSQPTEAVHALLSSTNGTALPVTPPYIDFDRMNWQTPVAVTVSPPIDKNNVSETAMISVTASPGPSSSIMATAVDATQINTYGWPAQLATTFSVLQGQIFAFRVTVPTSTLDSFGTLVPTAAGDFRMALYQDGGGVPGGLVTGAEFARRTLANGSNLTDITDVMIPAGTYWIALRFGSTTSVGAGDAAQTGTRCLRNTDIVNLDSNWPLTFGTATCSTASLFNVWITTYHQ
jgi:hypothetical protein